MVLFVLSSTMLSEFPPLQGKYTQLMKNMLLLN